MAPLECKRKKSEKGQNKKDSEIVSKLVGASVRECGVREREWEGT